MSEFFDIFSKYQFSFRKGHSAQHCILAITEKWKKLVDNGGAFGALLIDLLKAFDCILHDLIIVKLEAYGFQIDALRIVYDCPSNRKQRVKFNKTFSSWRDIEYGVPQASILGAILDAALGSQVGIQQMPTKMPTYTGLRLSLLCRPRQAFMSAMPTTNVKCQPNLITFVNFINYKLINKTPKLTINHAP